MSSINGQIKADVVVMDETYDVSVEIPTSKPVITENAYTLTIYNEAEVAKTPKTENVTMLAHIVAAYDENSTAKMPENFYLQLSPPASILPNVKKEDGSTTFAIKSLSIQFSTGAYTNAKEIPGSIPGTAE